MNDPAEIYKIIENDPFNWLETAEGLQMSAKLSWDALRALPKGPSFEFRESRIAYMQSFMLLTAFAFENICRGIATLTKPDGWRHLANQGGGHGIKDAVEEFVLISAEESYLLERLETHLRWAGRYLIPKRSDQYVTAVELRLRSVLPGDWLVVENLFSRLKATLQKNYDEQAARDPLSQWP